MTTTYDRNEVTSASNALADELCPGRFCAQKGIPDVTSEDAAHGRAIHSALKADNDAGLTFEQKDIMGSIQSIEIALVAQFFGINSQNAMEHCQREQSFVIKVREHEHGCTPDVVYRWRDQALILEYKTLPGDVADAQTNRQTRDQVVVVAEEFFAVFQIGAAIIQPLVTHKPLLVVYDRDAVNLARTELIARVLRSHDPASPRIPGSVQCQFCKAKPVCKEYQGWVTQTLPVPVDIMQTPVKLWSPIQRLMFCENKGAAAKWLDETTKAMKAGLKEDPNFIPGWGLDDGDERRHVTDMQALYGRFEMQGGTLPAFMKCVKLTLKTFEEEVAAVTKAKGKKLKDQVSRMLEGLVEIKRTESALVRKDK